MKDYLVRFYLKDNKVYERICKSSSKFNAVNNAIRNSNIDNFDNIKIYEVKLNYQIIEEEE